MSDMPERIRNYLQTGGLFNPELMDPDKVSKLLLDCLSEFKELEAEKEEYKRLYEHRGKVIAKACIHCGYEPKKIVTQENKQ